jgi:protein-S-isoprenylcysteine O-methyltransferase Ste14
MSAFKIFALASFFILEIVIAGKTVVLKKNNIKVSSSSKNAGFAKYFLFPVYLLVVLVFLLELINPVFYTGLSFLPAKLSTPLSASVLLQTTGVIFTTVSLILLSKTLFDFKNSLRFGTYSNNLGELITTGIFSVSRNPFFISIELYFIGIALLLTTPFFIAIALLSIISIHFYILKEEKFLADNYGEAYKNYAKNVRRYF